MEFSRRGFFGKALACLGAALAWSKSAVAANLSYLTAAAPREPLAHNTVKTFVYNYHYDADGELIAGDVIPGDSYTQWTSYDCNGLVQSVSDGVVGDTVRVHQG